MLKFYKEKLKFVENYKPLAYYFIENRNLSKDVKVEIRAVYKQFTEKIADLLLNGQPERNFAKDSVYMSNTDCDPCYFRQATYRHPSWIGLDYSHMSDCLGFADPYH